MLLLNRGEESAPAKEEIILSPADKLVIALVDVGLIRPTCFKDLMRVLRILSRGAIQSNWFQPLIGGHTGSRKQGWTWVRGQIRGQMSWARAGAWGSPLTAFVSFFSSTKQLLLGWPLQRRNWNLQPQDTQLIGGLGLWSLRSWVEDGAGVLEGPGERCGTERGQLLEISLDNFVGDQWMGWAGLKMWPGRQSLLPLKITVRVKQEHACLHCGWHKRIRKTNK